MTNGVHGASGNPIFHCLPNVSAGKLLGIEATAPTRIVRGIGGRQFYPHLVEHVKQHPREASR